MNYRHIYHAGNFADVVKHATLALAIERLKQKAAPFRVIDTHAGIGTYDLLSEEALRTGEWKDGIGRLIGPDAVPLPPGVATILAPYLDVVKGMNPPEELRRYPGSPRIARALMRPQDRLVVNELHPQDAAALRADFGKDAAVKILALDGWTTLKSVLPPRERRGVVLVDPPFETAGELQRMEAGIGEAIARFATGIYLLWYPIKDQVQVARFKSSLLEIGLTKLMSAELWVSDDHAPGLTATGLAIVNPPFEMDKQLTVLLPFLARRLGRGTDHGWRLDWLRGGP